MPEESLGTRLRQERERRQITLASVEACTKIAPMLLRGLERDDVSLWPSGLYRRSFFRAYAAAIGLDPEPALREFLERFPDPAQPPRAATMTATLPPPAAADAAEPRPALRLMLADTRSSFMGGRLLSTRKRWAAAACDAAVLLVIAGAFLLALGEFWLPLSVTIAFYYLGAILILGNTPGVCLFAPRPARRTDAPEWEEEATDRLSGLWRVIGRGAAWASSHGAHRSDR